MRKWDVFLGDQWVGLMPGRVLEDVTVVARKAYKDEYLSLCYAEWFGPDHPKNCKARGGKYANPTPVRYIGRKASIAANSAP